MARKQATVIVTKEQAAGPAVTRELGAAFCAETYPRFAEAIARVVKTGATETHRDIDGRNVWFARGAGRKVEG